MNTGVQNHQSSDLAKINGLSIIPDKLNYGTRLTLYKSMLKHEPRIWTRNHHLIRLWTNTFTVNFSIYCLYKIYYNYYNKSLGFFDSIKNSHKIKLLLITMILVDASLIYLNYFKLHDYVYGRYYSHIPDIEYLGMYDSIVTLKQIKKQDFYQSK